MIHESVISTNFHPGVEITIESRQGDCVIKKLLKAINELSCQNICINFSDCSPDKLKMILKTDKLILNKDPMADLEIENLTISFEPESISDETETGFNLEDINLKISEGFLNTCFAVLSSQVEDLVKLKLIISHDRLKIKGVYRKVISWPFEIDLKIQLLDNVLKVRWEGFWAMGIIPLPQKVRELILDIAKKNLESSFICFQKDQMEIDLSKIENVKINLKGLYLEKGFISFSS